MDWSPSEQEAGLPVKNESLLLPPTSAELQELSFSVHQLQSLNSSGRRLGRKISHKKSASDTFAFAAGQDFLALLAERPPLEPAGHARHASSGAGLSGSPTADTDQHMEADAAQQQQAGSSLADAAQQPTASDTAAVAAALGRTVPASASDPGTAAAAAAAAAVAADAAAGTQTRGNALDTTQLDPRKAKRILANRQSAQRSRMKRLQYINELEGRRDKAEAGVRELRSKLDKAQRQHTNLAQVVDNKKAEVSTLEQQLMYEQSVQANLSSYIQALQLQMQQQQQWSGSQMSNGHYMQQAQAQTCAADGYPGQQSGYIYNAAAAQCLSQQSASQQGQQQLFSPDGPGAASTQAQQQWPGYVSGPHSTQLGLLQQQQAQQQQVYGYGVSQAAHAQQLSSAGQHLQQQDANAMHPGAMVSAAAARAAASAPALSHRRSLSGASAGNAHAVGMADAAAPFAGAGGQQQLYPGLVHGAAQAAGPQLAGGAVSADTTAAAAAAIHARQGNAAAAALSDRAFAAGQSEDVSIARKASLSQGSGSVLVHGSVGDADLDSLLGLGPALSPILGPGQLDSNGLQVMGLLGAGESGLLVPPDDLLAQDASSL